GAGLDPPESKRGELLGSPILDEAGEGRRRSATVPANRHVELTGLLVKREEVGIAGIPLSDLPPSLHERPTGAVVFGPAKLFEGLVDAEERHERHPPKPPVALRGLGRKPAIV